MRISCSTLEDFVANLEGENVYRGVIYVSRISKPLNGTKRDATSFEVLFQASAVLDFADGQALLDYGESCGIDRLTADGGMDGTVVQTERLEKLKAYCSVRSLAIKPGVIDE